jgi:hypothetical protein
LYQEKSGNPGQVTKYGSCWKKKENGLAAENEEEEEAFVV